jgi:hypothetical protein
VEGIWLVSHLWVKGFPSHHSQESISTPEEAAGIFSKVFFQWMHPVLREGYSAKLNLESLPEIDQRLLSKGLRKRVLTYWARECELRVMAARSAMLINIWFSQFSYKMDASICISAVPQGSIFVPDTFTHISHFIHIPAAHLHWNSDKICRWPISVHSRWR